MIDHPIPGLSRRDRAALVMTYECLRDGAGRHFIAGAEGDILPQGGPVGEALHDAVMNEWFAHQDCEGNIPTAVQRACSLRLALLLRAVLRADAADAAVRERFDDRPDYGAWWVADLGNGCAPTFYEHADAVRFLTAFPGGTVRLARPLWNLPVDEGRGGKG